MDTDGETSRSVAPRLRFPRFVGKKLSDVLLDDVTEDCTTRNGEDDTTLPIMGVSKTDGIVPMEERLIGKDITRYKRLEKNWFAYNPMRLNIGSIARWKGDDDVLVSPDYVVFRCLTDGELTIDPAYLDHFRFSHQWEDFVGESGDGGVRIRIYYKDLARLPLRLPSPAEQQKIADCLTSLDELIGAQTRQAAALAAHKRGLMQHLFPREGESLPRLRFPEFREEVDWTERSLKDVVKSFKTGKLDANAMVEGGRYRFYTCARNHFAIDDYAFEGEALLVAGNGAHLGYIHHYIGKFNAYQRTYVLQEFNVHVLFLKFLLDIYLPPRIQLEKKEGNTPYIVLATLTDMRIWLPASPVEQQRIAACLSALDAQLAAASEKLAALKAHKKGLMQQLFPAAEASE